MILRRRRIAITGVGMVTPVGLDAPTTWSSLLEGHSGVGPIQTFDARGFAVRIGAEVKNFQAETAIADRRVLKLASRPVRFALAAAEEALADAGIRPEPGSVKCWRRHDRDYL